MKRFACAVVSTFLLTSFVYADKVKNYKNDALPTPIFKPYYVAIGAGGAFPAKNSSIVDNTDLEVYGPTTLGDQSFFELDDVSWDNTYKNGYEVNLALGYRKNPYLATELEFIYQHIYRDIEGQYTWTESYFPSHEPAYAAYDNPVARAQSSVNLYSLLGNVVFSYANSTAFTPFIGAGLGVAFMNSSGTTTDGLLIIDVGSPPLDATAPTTERSPAITGTAFGWQFKTGVEYHLSETLSFILQYRLLGTTQLNASSSTIVTNPDTSTGDFVIPSHPVSGLIINGLDLNVRLYV